MLTEKEFEAMIDGLTEAQALDLILGLFDVPEFSSFEEEDNYRGWKAAEIELEDAIQKGAPKEEIQKLQENVEAWKRDYEFSR